MLSLGAATRVYLAPGATDLRKGFEGLFAAVRGKLEKDPLSGHVFVFCNRGRDRLKLLYFDGSGLWICAKRLERGSFRWPALEDASAVMTLSRAELVLLLEGIDLKAGRARAWYRREVAEEPLAAG
jgi:transposase